MITIPLGIFRNSKIIPVKIIKHDGRRVFVSSRSDEFWTDRRKLRRIKGKDYE